MSQETKNYQYERNDFNTYGVRGSASGGGTEVVANPEGTATDDLEKLQVGDSIYGIPEGTVVGANPVLAGTEPNLTGLQIGDTKYAVPTPHTINTYTAGTLSEADQAKIANDIANHYPIIVNNITYSYTSSNNNRAYYMFNRTDHGYNGTMNVTDYGTLTYNFINHQLSLTPGTYNVVAIQETSFNYSDTYGSVLTRITTSGQPRIFGAMSTYALTTAPTADNTDGGIRLVVLTSEPATYYNGYYYIIAPTP